MASVACVVSVALVASVACIGSVAGVEILALVSKAYGAHGAHRTHGKLTNSFASSLASSSWLAFQRLQQWIHPRKKHEEPTFLQLPNVQTGCSPDEGLSRLESVVVGADPDVPCLI